MKDERNEFFFHEISCIFCDFQFERYRPTDRASYRSAMAHLKNPLSFNSPTHTLYFQRILEILNDHFFPPPLFFFLLHPMALIENLADEFLTAFCSCKDFEDCTLDCSCPHAYYQPPPPLYATAVMDSGNNQQQQSAAAINTSATTDDNVIDRQQQLATATAEAVLATSRQQQGRQQR